MEIQLKILEDHIIKEDGKELKAWDAIARYMRSFDDTDDDGISNVSKYYASTQIIRLWMIVRI